ncbi:hypothetical protein GCM10011490_24390 [Pseudoclavibacter endophyticus]|nr:hypothetical protein GCM10011490_24390 [Pseudoclavibacter endophyticus]
MALGKSDDDAAALYSHLSGVAHGESVFTESLSDKPPQNGASGLALPRQNLRTYGSMMHGITFIGTIRLLKAWGAPSDIVDAYFNAAKRAGDMLPKDTAV